MREIEFEISKEYDAKIDDFMLRNGIKSKNTAIIKLLNLGIKAWREGKLEGKGK